ncbi:MAG TPA: ribosome maturation factor RimM [Solimonas sp.]|nr:ribosome maturation factor RimM [Solimonas sp.]
MDGRRVTLGRVAGVYGIKGWVKVVSYTRPLENILEYAPWHLVLPEGRPGKGFETEVVEGRAHGRGIVAQLRNAAGQAIDDRDEAAALMGCEIQIEREQLPALPEGQHYWIDLIGLKVENEQGVALGRIRDMTSNGAQDVMVVQDGDTERMIPFVPGPIVKQVDVQAGRVVCDWQADY